MSYSNLLLAIPHGVKLHATKSTPELPEPVVQLFMLGCIEHRQGQISGDVNLGQVQSMPRIQTCPMISGTEAVQEVSAVMRKLLKGEDSSASGSNGLAAHKARQHASIVAS